MLLLSFLLQPDPLQKFQAVVLQHLLLPQVLVLAQMVLVLPGSREILAAL